MRIKTVRLGPAGVLACAAGSIGMAALASGWRTVAAAAIAAGLALAFYPEALRVLGRLRALGMLALLALGGLLTGDGWPLGVQMALRAAVILVAVRGLTARVGVMDLLGLLGGAQLAPLGFAVGVGINALPWLSRSLATTSAALRMRGGWRRPMVAIRVLLATMLVNLLQYGDQVVAAAESRAFDPAHVPIPAAPRVTRAEWGVIGGVIVATLALWWL